jgi:hypothetical protein
MSVYRDILAAVQNGVDGLALDGFSKTAIRKRPHIVRTDFDDGSGIVIISPSAEIVAEEYTENTENIDYPVHVTFAQAGDGVVDVSATNSLLDAREAVRLKFHKTTLTGVSSVIDVRVFLSRLFDPFMFGTNIDASQLTLIFKSTEPRSQ